MGKVYWGFIRAALLGIALALIITAAFEPAKVQGTSMAPSIMERDTILLNKVSYLAGNPKCGDIVVFELPLYTEDNPGKMLVKRVIATEGDTVEIRDGKVYRNNDELSEEYVSSYNAYENMKSTKVEPGFVFVMGDNRTVSRDSRDEIIGPVAISDILGKVTYRMLPFDTIGKID